METTKVKHIKIKLFETDKDKDMKRKDCTCTQAVSIVNGTAYVLKHTNDENEKKAILAVIKNLDSNEKAVTQVNSIQICDSETKKNHKFKHPNGLTHYNKAFYMVDFGNKEKTYIYRFLSTGIITNSYKLGSNLKEADFKGKSPSCITKYKNGDFIIGADEISYKENSVDKYKRIYYVVSLENGKIIKKATLSAKGFPISEGSDTYEGNDICYYNGKLYITIVKKTNDCAKLNFVYIYTVPNFSYPSVPNTTTELTLTRILEDKCDETQEKRYEIEGLQPITYTADEKEKLRTYVVAERELKTKVKGRESDGILMLKTLQI